MKASYHIIIKWGVILLLFALFFTLYSKIAFNANLLMNDIDKHAGIALRYWEGKKEVGAPILYALAMILSFSSKNVAEITLCFCILLAFATTLRFGLVQTYIQKLELCSNSLSKNYWLSVISGLSLIFIFAIPIATLVVRGWMYLGNFTPNVWHNSTTIFLFPFAILLYYNSYKQFDSYSPRRDITIFILILLNLYIKPSFFFAFACAYPLIMLYQYRFSKTFWRAMLPLVGGVVALALISWVLYNPNNETGSGITLSWFTFYKAYNPLLALPFALILSILFPILYIVYNRKKLKYNLMFWYTALLFLISFLIFAFISESGPRSWDGNLYWQIVPSVWLLFAFTFISLLKDIKREGMIRKNKLLLLIYSLHIVSGIAYLVRAIIFDFGG